MKLPIDTDAAKASILGDVVVDVVQTAYRAAEPNTGTAIFALATTLHAEPALLEVAELAGPLIQRAADQPGTRRVAVTDLEVVTFAG